MEIANVAKAYVVYAPDHCGPGRIGHGIYALITASNEETAVIHAPLSVGDIPEQYRVRDAYDWTRAVAHELQLKAVKQTANGKIRFTFEA